MSLIYTTMVASSFELKGETEQTAKKVFRVTFLEFAVLDVMSFSNVGLNLHKIEIQWKFSSKLALASQQ